ncbi:MAG: DUF3303 domain-containing protein [Chitinophagaceae bacterium]|nr:DUF3303 domain-containing protein [Chitinophagaceae bacterium]
MVIEKFMPGRVKDLYQRFAETGRMLPEGVVYIDSWISKDLTRCYQLMEADSLEDLNLWIANWDDLADFEVIPIISSEEARAKVLGH